MAALEHTAGSMFCDHINCQLKRCEVDLTRLKSPRHNGYGWSTLHARPAVQSSLQLLLPRVEWRCTGVAESVSCSWLKLSLFLVIASTLRLPTLSLSDMQGPFGGHGQESACSRP